MRRARYRLCALGHFWFLTHDGFVLVRRAPAPMKEAV
jgi:hypothetical protein